MLEEKETDMCLLESHEERLKTIDTDLQAIKRNMLFIDNHESLARRKGRWLVRSFIRAMSSHEAPAQEYQGRVCSG